jgi:hypothetical protein
MPALTRYLRKLVGVADIRSVPIDWPGIIRRLRECGWKGKLPRSLHRHDYVPPPYLLKIASYGNFMVGKPSEVTV